jgi:hypothetical protein
MMNRYAPAHLLGVLTVVMMLQTGCGSAAPVTGTVQGTVMAGGVPAAGVKVDLLNDPFGKTDPLKNVATTTTDSNGKYSFKDVKPGTYVLSAAVTGHCVIIDLPDPFTVEAGKVIDHTDMNLPCKP